MNTSVTMAVVDVLAEKEFGISWLQLLTSSALT
jgi:hypothetical protein